MPTQTDIDDAEEPGDLNQLTEDPDAWVKAQIAKATPVRLTDEEKIIIPALIEQAAEFSRAEQIPCGYALAAVFDLFVSMAYYAQIVNTGWLYCPLESPLLIHNFGMNVCPRCVLKGEFHFYEAGKPPSGSIGKITRRLLCAFLLCLFERDGRKLEVLVASEPVDVIVYDRANQTVLLAEAKSGPLTILPLIQNTEPQTEVDDDGNAYPRPHRRTDNTHLSSKEVFLLLPVLRDGKENDEYIRLSPLTMETNRLSWAHEQIQLAFVNQPQNLANYFHFWQRAFAAYGRGRRDPIPTIFWWTGASGSPKPRPIDWPNGRTISDSKTTVGMDRTDDIKKATYQVLKIATAAKPKATFRIKTALLSNIHAVRHHETYLTDLQDIVWTPDPSRQAKRVGDLPDEQELYNLFDGIISFTKNHARDEWIEQNFQF